MRKFFGVSLLIALLAMAGCAAPVAAPAAAPAATEAATEAAAVEAAPAEAAAGAMEIDPMAVTGDIVTAGSSTVYPLSEAVVEQFIDEGYAGQITIDSIGTGAGFERFCVAGESDVANASRAIKDSEVESCTAIGRTPIGFKVATDALAIVVNPGNDWVGEEGLTVEQIAKLFSQDVTNWSDVDPSWPAEPVVRFSPGTDSGTFDYFIEAVMDKTFVTSEAEAGKGEEALLSAANLNLSEDDNVLVQGVEGDKYSIGYFGFAYFIENEGRIRDLAVNGVVPSAETVEANEYPLSRPLFIYSDAAIITDKPQVGQFIAYYLTVAGSAAEAVGYFPASEAVIAESMAALTAAMGQ